MYCHHAAAVFRKLQLLLLCAEAALLNKCLPQTDTFLKAAISYIPEMPAETVMIAFCFFAIDGYLIMEWNDKCTGMYVCIYAGG